MKKRYMYILLIVMVLTVAIDYSIFFKENGLKQGVYYNSDKTSYVQINSDNTFDFRIHVLMDTAVYGQYVIEDDILTLVSDLGEFRFYVKNNTLIFKEGNYLTGGSIEKDTKYKLE